MAKAEKERVDTGGEKRFHFDFAGKFFEDSEKTYFESYVKDNKLEEYVTYHSIVGGEAKRSLLKECYIFALPTRYPNEGQPISILEAMGNGMFIITTDHAGIPDIVEDGVNGVMMRDNDIARKVYKYIFDLPKADKETICRRNRSKCICEFSQNGYTNKMKRIFDNV